VRDECRRSKCKRDTHSQAGEANRLGGASALSAVLRFRGVHAAPGGARDGETVRQVVVHIYGNGLEDRDGAPFGT